MDINNQRLAHSLKIKFGTAPGEPNDFQLEQIKSDAYKILQSGRQLSDSDWFEIVKRHCPGAGHYAYKGLDNSDLVTLLRLATKPTNR